MYPSPGHTALAQRPKGHGVHAMTIIILAACTLAGIQISRPIRAALTACGIA